MNMPSLELVKRQYGSQGHTNFLRPKNCVTHCNAGPPASAQNGKSRSRPREMLKTCFKPCWDSHLDASVETLTTIDLNPAIPCILRRYPLHWTTFTRAANDVLKVERADIRHQQVAHMFGAAL